MNNTIEVMKNHRSIRSYKNEKISEEIIDTLVDVAQHSPNSINGQQTSIIVVRDKETKKKIAKYAGGQPWIEEAPVFFLFTMDFYKTRIACENADKEQQITDSAEAIIVGSVDAGLSMQNVITAAESLGLGTVCIGGIRNNPQGMIELLNLPEYTFPIVGLCIGYPDGESRLKPRMPKEAYRHNEVYNKEVIKPAIAKYDEEMAKYLEEIGRADVEINWSNSTSKYYQYVYFPTVNPTLKKQGFKNEK